MDATFGANILTAYALGEKYHTELEPLMSESRVKDFMDALDTLRDLAWEAYEAGYDQALTDVGKFAEQTLVDRQKERQQQAAAD